MLDLNDPGQSEISRRSSPSTSQALGLIFRLKEYRNEIAKDRKKSGLVCVARSPDQVSRSLKGERSWWQP
jgi:hypothetical protein